MVEIELGALGMRKPTHVFVVRIMLKESNVLSPHTLQDFLGYRGLAQIRVACNANDQRRLAQHARIIPAPKKRVEREKIKILDGVIGGQATVC